MSATRLLVLGMVRGYGRVHGYRVGSELLSWGAGEWAHVKWGSIYHALRAATDAGFLRAHDAGGRTDYELTEQGDAEFHRLLRDALRQPQPRPDLIAAALAMLPALPRAEALDLLHERLAALERTAEKARVQLDGWAGPPHVRELFELWEHTAAVGVQWTRALVGRLEVGAYPLAGEPGPPGRPGSWRALRGEPDLPATQV